VRNINKAVIEANSFFTEVHSLWIQESFYAPFITKNTGFLPPPIKKVLNLHVIQSDPSYVGLSDIGYEIQSHPGEAIGGGWGIIH
jgi:hypothetical protein